MPPDCICAMAPRLPLQQKKPKCKSKETETDSHYYARGSLKGLSCRRSSACCTSRTFGESYPKTWRWSCLPRMSSLFSSHSNKEIAEAAIQEAITNVAEWSRCRKLTLNASKREIAFFTNHSKEVRWQLTLQLDGTLLNTTSLLFPSVHMSPQ